MKPQLQQNIEQKIKARKVFIKKFDDSYVVKTGKHKIKEPKEIDSIGKEIRSLIEKNVNILPIDFSIESLTMLGEAPNVMKS